MQPAQQGIDAMEPMMVKPGFRIKVTASDDGPFTAMFEPTGMTYELGASEFMFAEVPDPQWNEMEIVHWDGGISIWPPGPVITRDANGAELHHLN